MRDVARGGLRRLAAKEHLTRLAEPYWERERPSAVEVRQAFDQLWDDYWRLFWQMLLLEANGGVRVRRVSLTMSSHYAAVISEIGTDKGRWKGGPRGESDPAGWVRDRTARARAASEAPRGTEQLEKVGLWLAERRELVEEQLGLFAVYGATARRKRRAMIGANALNRELAALARARLKWMGAK